MDQDYHNEHFHLTNWSCPSHDHQWREEIYFDSSQTKTFHTLEPKDKNFNIQSDELLTSN